MSSWNDWGPKRALPAVSPPLMSLEGVEGSGVGGAVVSATEGVPLLTAVGAAARATRKVRLALTKAALKIQA